MNYKNKSRDELITLCKEKNIKGYSKKNKDDLTNLLMTLKIDDIPPQIPDKLESSYIATFTTDELKKDYAKLVSSSPVLPVSCHHRQGMKLLEHFNPHFWETEGVTGDSIAKLWTDHDIKQKAIDRTLKHYKKIYISEIRRNLAFYSRAPLPTMYRPILTKALVEKLGSKNVLDCCVGWGGRMIGTASVPGTHFTGIEPASKTHTALVNIANYVGITNHVTLIHAPAEQALLHLPSDSFDLVLTSPPYFNLEVYGHEETQSIFTNSTWESWCDNFLKVCIREGLRCLKTDGVSAWSVKNMPKYKLKDKVFEYHIEFGYEHYATEGMTSTPRNTGKASKLTEETFLFRKII